MATVAATLGATYQASQKAAVAKANVVDAAGDMIDLFVAMQMLL